MQVETYLPAPFENCTNPYAIEVYRLSKATEFPVYVAPDICGAVNSRVWTVCAEYVYD